MSAREIIKSVFIDPFSAKSNTYIGVELEFPLLNLKGETPEESVTDGLLSYLLENGFFVDETDIYGKGVFLMNADGDCLSFDNDYSNFEFAMEKGTDLISVSKRFYALYDLVQSYLKPLGYTLTGLGTNPYHHKLTGRPVDYPIYRTIRQYLSGRAGEKGCHPYGDFPAWLSSVQTHLDMPLSSLPQALSLFSALDFAHGLLFANSLPFADSTGFENTLCFRDYLWEKSGFGLLSDNTGPVCGTFSSTDDLIDLFLQKSIVLKKDGDTYHEMEITPLADYLETQQSEMALDGYLSFKNIELTRRGTLEVRSDCAQPVSAAFAAPAFHLGVSLGLEEAEHILDEFLKTLPEDLQNSPDRNAILRHLVCTGEELPVSKERLSCLLTSLLRLAETKLLERGYGEELLLKPLYARAERLNCPAKETKKRLAAGESWESIIADYANPDYIL